MAKRELSSTLRNLKFMQRVAVKTPDNAEDELEKKDQIEKEKVENFTNSNSPFGVSPLPRRKCVVIMEGNPKPGAIKGRMSFQSFNPSIDKLHEEAANGNHQMGSSPSSPVRVDGSTSTSPSNEPEPDLKRKNQESESEKLFPKKVQKNTNGDINNQPSSSSERNNNGSNNKRKEFKKPPKHDKLDWSVLRPPRKP